MATDLVEVTEVLDHPIDRVWALLTDLDSYPKFVAEVAWCEHLGDAAGGRYEVRFSVDQGPVVQHEVEILVNRPREHLVIVSDRWPGGHVSLRFAAPDRARTEVQLTVSLPNVDTSVTGSWLRKRVRRAFTLIHHHLAGIPITASRKGIDQAAKSQSQLTAARILTKAGVLTPGRPDRLLRQLNVLAKWGATVAGGYRATCVRFPNEHAIADELGTLTFTEVDQRTTRLANGLMKHGVRQGRRVAVMCRNHAGLVESIVACGKLGASVLLLNTSLSANQVRDTVMTHRPAAVLVDEEFMPLVHYLPTSLPRILTWGKGDKPGDITIDGLIEKATPERIKAPSSPGKIIVLTSGTTSNPKGARRRNPHGIRTAAAVLSRIPFQAGERMMVAAPLFHTWGLAAVQLGMPLHAKLVLHRRFDPEATLQAIEEHRCTTLIAVPIMLQRILDLPRQVIRNYDLSSLRIVASSGSAMPASLVTDFMAEFGDVLYNLYGSTEVSWASIADPEDLKAAPTTAGRCPVGTRVGILDANGRPVPPGVVGQICVGNDMLFEGYTGGGSNAVYDDMMVTGDRGYLDADGRLFVSGRDDDMIVSGGENVFPRPVEELLMTLPQVMEAAVVGVPDREFGQRFAAYVVPRPGAAISPTAVREYVHAHLPRFAVPRDVIFVNALPRNATGKVVRRRLLMDS
ncbi:AMP-binding protein [Actinophytocola glycyrrhizae]|uniref:AMP-binding protein n=1 Tax=Actinophytocola glycyrrhizae TaxID=2044873 RepID=A0ABV9RT23_9PSEU